MFEKNDSYITPRESRQDATLFNDNNVIDLHAQVSPHAKSWHELDEERLTSEITTPEEATPELLPQKIAADLSALIVHFRTYKSESEFNEDDFKLAG